MIETQGLMPRTLSFVKWGLTVGFLYSLLLVPWLLTAGNRPIPRYGATPLQIAALYLLSGMLGGVVVALLYPIKRWFLGAFVLGALAAFPVYLGVALLLRGNDPRGEAWVFGGVAAFFVGGGVGTQISSESHSRPIPSPRLLLALWIVVGICQIGGWYLGLRWPGETRAMIGAALVFLPLFLAALATLSRRGAGGSRAA